MTHPANTPASGGEELRRLRARAAELEQAIDAAPGWGAAVGAMAGELKGVQRRIIAFEKEAAAPPLNTGPEVGWGGEPRIVEGKTWTGAPCPVLEPAPADAGEDLAGLSARATQGSAFTVSDEIRVLIEPQPWPGAYHVIAKVSGERSKENAAAIVAFWNAYRSGCLTPAASRPVEYPRDKMAAVLSACEVEQDIDLGRDGAQQAHYDAIDAIIGVLPALQPAPAASRPAVGREEIAWSLLCSLRTDITEPKLREILATEERLGFSKPWHTAWEVARRQADAILALLDPRDDTRAGGDQAQGGADA